MNSTKPNHDPKAPALTLSRVIIALLVLIAGLQVASMFQLADHDERLERRAEYAIDARNAIRDQLDRMAVPCPARAAVEAD
jgi:hypothetical protein